MKRKNVQNIPQNKNFLQNAKIHLLFHTNTFFCSKENKRNHLFNFLHAAIRLSLKACRL